MHMKETLFVFRRANVNLHESLYNTAHLDTNYSKGIMLSFLFFILNDLSDVEDLCTYRQRNGRTKYILNQCTKHGNGLHFKNCNSLLSNDCFYKKKGMTIYTQPNHDKH